MATREHVDIIGRSVEETNVSEGELNDVTAILPEPIRKLFGALQ
jgi:hypothetical protein